MIRSIQLRHTNLRTLGTCICTPLLSCVSLQQYRACVVDSLGLGITCVLYTVLCVQGIPILSPLLFMPSLYSTL